MSWDIYVQDLPDVTRVADIPDDFRPEAIFARSDLIREILSFEPSVNFENPAWGILDTAEFSIEFNIGDSETVKSFAMHIRGSELVVGFVGDLLQHLGVRGLDPQSDTGLFDPVTAMESFRQWQGYRDRVIE